MSKYKISMKKLAEAIIQRRSRNYDVFCIVDGPRGNGKSTFIYKLMCHLGEFIPERDIVFSREDLVERMKLKFGLIMQDEMINAAHNRDFYEKEQKLLVKMLNMYRDNYNIIFGAVPFFYDLDPQVRKFVALRITIAERGKAILQKAKSSMFTNDPWETDSNRKIEMEMQRSMRAGRKVRPNYTKLTTFWSTLEYGALSPKQEARYHRIKESKRNKLMEVNEEDVIKKEKELTEQQKLALKYMQGHITRSDIEAYAKIHEKRFSSLMAVVNRYAKDYKQNPQLASNA